MDLHGQLSILFGTEQEVKLRRQLVLLREKLMNHQYHEDNTECLCSGSLGEGVTYPSSDDDIMFYKLAYRVLMTSNEVKEDGELVMLPSEHSHMYCLLWDITRYYPLETLQIINGMPVLSSSLRKQCMHQETVMRLESIMGVSISLDMCGIHGPCLSQKIGNLEFDNAFCFPCPKWPDVAYGWITRNRLHEWPSYEMVRNIVSSGCLVVPIGDPDSPNYLHEWRISFSRAERMLMHSFNHCQFLTYNLLRLTLKRIIQEEVPDVLCSYFMKTTLFYSAENTPKLLWKLENLDMCFKHCLSVLYSFINNTFCPNYFIPVCNMIKRKVNHTNQQQMLDLIQCVYNIGVIGVVHLSRESICFDEGWTSPIREMKCDGDFLFSLHLGKIHDRLVSMLEYLNYKGIDTCSTFLFNFLKILELHSSSTRGIPINIILHRGITYSCHQMMNFLWNSPRLNKQNYNLNKYVTALLRLGYIHNGDLTTGRLTMATYMFIVGKTDQSLSVIGRLLSEYPPYAMDNCLSELQRTTYMEVMCDKGYTIGYKAKCAYAPGYEFYSSFLHAFPSPLRIWIFTSIRITLFPLSYAYLLQCLCYIRQKNCSSLIISKRFLEGQIRDLTDDIKKANVRMCLGIINLVQGYNKSACRWLRSAYVMKSNLKPPHDEMFSRSVLTYMACMLNYQIRHGIHLEENSIVDQKVPV